MRERGIIFNAEMVRAILDGRKTQTRRIVKVQPESPAFGLRYIIEATKTADIGKYFWSESNAIGNRARSTLFPCPFGQPGERLWVRETCQAVELESGLDVVRYAADSADIPVKAHPLDAGMWIDLYRYRKSEGKIVPSIHMPRWASRITLEITGVRVERLQSISGEDARSEGFSYEDSHVLGDIDEFSRLWASIYGADSWQANPWVWVVEFKRVERQP
nr:hypothetical protein [uncultured Erwinia sp.]